MTQGPGRPAEMSPVTVLCAVRGQAEAEIVSALAASSALEVTRRCADLAEVMAAAAAGLGQVVVVSEDLPGLDRLATASLQADGARVLAVVDGQHPGSAAGDRLVAIGCDAVVGVGTVEEELVRAVQTLAARAQAGPFPVWQQPGAPTASSLGGPEPGRGAGDLGGGPGGLPAPPPPPPAQVTTDSLVVAVWGPTGAPGRSTLALNIAAELVAQEVLRRRGRRAAPQPRTRLGPVETALLVDADSYSGTLAQAVGMTDESAGIAAACRSAAQGTLTVEGLAGMTPFVADNLRILTGISRASRWPELTEAALEVVWEQSRRIARWVVVDCGFNLERDEMLSYDTRAPQRNGATLSALAAADVVVAVGGAGPVGVQRLVRGLEELREAGLVEHAHRLVVVNRVRASAVGPRPSSALREALRRYASVSDAFLVADDQPAVDAALLVGRTLAEDAPGSVARRSIREVADHIRELPPAGASRPESREGRKVGAARAASAK